VICPVVSFTQKRFSADGFEAIVVVVIEVQTKALGILEPVGVQTIFAGDEQLARQAIVLEVHEDAAARQCNTAAIAEHIGHVHA